MPREILSSNVRRRVLHQSENRCHVCGFRVSVALTLHHIQPVEFGGGNDTSNLISICANCHKIVHAYATKQYAGDDLSALLGDSYSHEQAEKIQDLISSIREYKERADSNGQTDTLISLGDAIATVAKKQKYSASKILLFRQCIANVIARIPVEIRNRCNYRLVQSGQYISINFTNYLLFKSPGYYEFSSQYSAGGIGKLGHDLLLITPISAMKDRNIPDDKCDAKAFKNIPDQGLLFLNFEDVLAFSSQQWKEFQEGCHATANAPKSRDRISNLDVISTFTTTEV